MKRFLIILFCLFLVFPAGAEKLDTLPECFQITQNVTHEKLGDSLYTERAYPVTINENINTELAAVIDELYAGALPYLPAKAGSKDGTFADVGATVYRTGESWGSFLVTAFVQDNRQQLYIDMTTRAYDLLTGEKITLNDVISDDEGWAILSDAVKTQLSAYFPTLDADESTLNALADKDHLMNADFTLSVAYLQLHFRADALYEGKKTLMHVRVSYRDLANHLTEEAVRQTDNSMYKMVALTLDDGPTRQVTLSVLRNLRRANAGGTFFIVGYRIAYAPDYVAMEHDTGFSQGSHNYNHEYGKDVAGKLVEYRDLLNEKLSAVTGRTVTIMRAPGGGERLYIKEDVHLPLIHWSLVSKDAGGKVSNPASEARRLAKKAIDGDVILGHDMYASTAEYMETLPQLLNDRGFLCVTVDELFEVNGIELLPNEVYYGINITEYSQR